MQESEITAAVSLEEILFPSAEPWLISEQSKASARRSCLACATAAEMASPESAGAWLQAELSKIQQEIPGPMAGLIAARALQYGRQSSIWLRKGGSVEAFLQGQGEHLESAKAMQASVLSREQSDLFEPGADWLAQSAAWSSSMALGPMEGEKSSKAIFWEEISNFQKAQFGAGRASLLSAWADKEPVSGSAQTKSERATDFASAAYFLLGDLPQKGAKALTGRSEQELAKEISLVLYPANEQWSAIPAASQACQVISTLLARAALMEAATASEEGVSSANHLMLSGMDFVKRRFGAMGGSGDGASIEMAIQRSQRMGGQIAAWTLAGGNFEKFKALQSKAEIEMRAQARNLLPSLVSISEAKKASHETCRDWCVGQAARAKALSSGPLPGQAARAIMWEEMLREAAPSDDPARKEYCAALEGAPGFDGAPKSSVKALRQAAAIDLAQHEEGGFFSKASQAGKSAFIAFAQQLTSALDGTMARSAIQTAKAWTGSDKRTAGELALEIERRFGFEAVQVDGMDGTQSIKALRSAHAALAASAERLGVMDDELGRKGRSTLTLSGRGAVSRGAGGYCDTETGNITLAVPIEVATMVHEWAHSVDGLAGRAMGVGMMATEYAQRVSSDHPAALALAELAQAIRACPPFDEAHARQEQDRLGRVCAAKIAIQALGREKWSVLPRADRDSYLDQAAQAGFGIVCSQARAIMKNQDDMDGAPKANLKALRDSSGKLFAEGLERTAANAAQSDQGGWLGKNAREIAQILSRSHGLDLAQAVAIAARQVNADGLGLGLQALKVGKPMFDSQGVATIGPKSATAFDVACGAMNFLCVKRPSADPAAKLPDFPAGYYKQPWEVLARSVERFTAKGPVEQMSRATRLMLSPTTRQDARMFKQGWGKLLAVAGIQERPGGMKLAGGRCAAGVDVLFGALGAPMRVALRTLGGMSDNIAQRLAAKRLSRPEAQAQAASTSQAKAPS